MLHLYTNTFSMAKNVKKRNSSLRVCMLNFKSINLSTIFLNRAESRPTNIF